VYIEIQKPAFEFSMWQRTQGSTGPSKEARRDPAAFEIEGRMTLPQVSPPQWAAEPAAWRGMREVTHRCVHTVGLGLKTPGEHVQAL